MSEDSGSGAPSDGGNGPDNSSNGGGQGGGGQQNDWKPPASQDEFDRIISDRLTRERSKLTSQFAGFEDYKTKAEQLDALVETLKSKEEKLEERAAKAEQQLTPLQQRNTVLEVALAKQIPAELINRLHGNTKEEIEADADELMKLVKKDGREFPDLGGGNRGGNAKTTSMNDLIRAAAGRGN